jgi:hypothetical protein
MPSSVILRSRTQGLMMNHHSAMGKPIQTTTAFKMSGIFMYSGGSEGPPGTRSK